MLAQQKENSLSTPSAPPKEYVPYDERWTKQHGYDIKVKATTADFARKVHNHNQSRGFTSILEIGESGSGKTTLGQKIRHELHQIHNYIQKFFYAEQIFKIKEIVKKLPKGRDYILWFDDISFLIKKGLIKEDELMDIFHFLTKIRHVVKGNVVAMFVIHYPYAVEKFLRQAAYRVITSISDDQREIYGKLYGQFARPIIDKFIQMDRFQTEEGHFYLPNAAGEVVRLQTKQPFKIALASRMGDLTFMVYDRVDCDICSEEKHTVFEKEAIIERYNKSPKRFMRVTKWVGFVQGHVSLLSKNDRALYNWWMDYLQTRNISIEMLVEVLKDVKAAPADERDEFLLKRLSELEAKMKEKKDVVVPEEELQKDAAQEPEPETEDSEEEDDDDDNNLSDSIFSQFGSDEE